MVAFPAAAAGEAAVVGGKCRAFNGRVHSLVKRTLHALDQLVNVKLRPRTMTTVGLVRSLFTAFATAVALQAAAQCGTVAYGEAVPMHAPAFMHDRSDSAALFVIPTFVHVYYTTTLPPVSTQQVLDALADANLRLRGHNSDTADVCSVFRSIMGDLSLELRLAHLDENGDCTGGIEFIQWDGNGLAPDVSGDLQNTGKYLNIVVYPSSRSMSSIPVPGAPLPGDLYDHILFTTYDAQFQPWILAHEVGHWAGLYHTFGATNNSAVACGDDGVNDTPITAGSPVGTCDTTLSTCTPGVVENVDNVMDYSICEKMFTIGQQERVAAVMTDTTIARYMHCTPENLQATGVDIPSTCPLVSDLMHLNLLHCGQTEVRFHSMFTGQIPDQVNWLIPGGNPSTSNVPDPVVTYTTGGSFTVRMIACHGAECDTVWHELVIDPITGLQDNGLTVGTAPWSEGFENGFSFPQAHLAVRGNASSNWQPCGFAGYNSANSLYIPASSMITAMDTSDLVLGNFDFTGMASPGISFKMAATYYEPMQYSTFYLMLGDLCDQGLPLQSWSIYLQPDLAGSNSSAGFVPGGPAQWTTLHYTTPSWAFYPHAQLVLRVVKAPMWPLPDEDLFIDDINIGESDFVLGLQQKKQAACLRVYPDPAHDHVRICPPGGRSGTTLTVVDMTGRTVLTTALGGPLDLDVSAWPSGTYPITVTGPQQVQHAKVLVQH